VSVGAPPDGFFTGGQDWGTAPLHPQRTRESGHGYFRACIRNHLRFAAMLRIDHVMALHRLYWVPHGMSATEGVYVRYPAEELWAIVRIESQRAAAEIAGENLGTVPPSVNRAMARYGAKPLYVAQFAWNLDGARAASSPATAAAPLHPPRPGSVASVNTHDVPPFAAYWRGEDISERRAAGWLTEEQAKSERLGRVQLRRAMRAWLRRMGITPRRNIMPYDAFAALLEQLGASEANVVMVALEDLWLEQRSQNRPGVMSETNWRGRAKVSFEELQQLPQVVEALQRLDRARKGARL
jgi:4-alpha-glucanotransferase